MDQLSHRYFPCDRLGIEKGEKDIMKKKPRGSRSNFLSNGVGSSIIYQGILEGVLTLGVYWIAINYPFHESSALIHADALTMAYATLGVIQLFHAFNSKSIHGTIFSKETFNNKYFNIAVLASAVLLAMTIFVPAFNSTFHVTTLALEQWGDRFRRWFFNDHHRRSCEVLPKKIHLQRLI